MTIVYKDGTLTECIHPEYSYKKGIGSNGKSFVTMASVKDNVLNIATGNTKTGEKCLNFNNSIELSCDHNCECYKEGKCYAEQGCYCYLNNQRMYSENVKFFRTQSHDIFCEAVQIAIDKFKYNYFRWFTCGDVLNYDFLSCMVTIARKNQSIKFWFYTKKYKIVNRWIDENGDLPENLTCIFSHWMNNDGSYFPMNNKHNMPTSEFIPIGKEYLIKTVNFICPCSDPSVLKTCITCDHPCFDMKKGQKQALLEHSTKETKKRDKEIKKAHDELKKNSK